MLPKIQDNPRYIEDIKRFNSAIEKVENEKIKLEATNLLNKLVNEVKYLDNTQVDLFFSKHSTRTGMAEDLRKNLIGYRKKLEKLLSSYLK